MVYGHGLRFLLVLNDVVYDGGENYREFERKSKT